MAYTTTAGEEVGRSEANRLANLELQTAFDDLTARGLHKQAYDLIQRGSIEAPVQVASAAPVNGLLSSLGLNSNDSRAIQGLLSQFRRQQEDALQAEAGHQDHEDGPEVPGSTYNERALFGDYSKLRGMSANDLQKYIDDTSFSFKNTAKNLTDPLGLLSSALGIGPAYSIGKGLYNMDQNALATKIYDFTYGPGETGIPGPDQSQPTARGFRGGYTSDHGGLYDRDEYDHAPEMDLW